MPLVGRNIVANLVGGLLLTGMMLFLTPLQIRLLGMEAYGIIGFISALQVAFTVFDLGLSSTLTRELAADHSADKLASKSLIQTALTVYWGCAVLIGAVLAFAAPHIARDWFNASDIPEVELTQSLRVIGIYLALRWPVAVYTGILTGMQRMEALNIIKVAVLFLRMAGGIVVLLVWHSLTAFLWWTAFSALIEIAAYDVASRRLFPAMPRRPGFSMEAIRRVWRFSISMNLLAVLAVVMVQFDRLLISKLLPLESLGSYNLAYTAASVMTLLVTSVGTAVLPSFAATHSRGDLQQLNTHREHAERLLLFLVTPVAGALIVHGRTILAIWVGEQAANAAYLPMAVLAGGFWLSAAVANVYNAAVAAGRPHIHASANLIAVLPYLSALYVLIRQLGIRGAAIAWVLLNLGYAAVLTPLVLRRLLHASSWGWLKHSVAPFAALGGVCFGAPAVLAEAFGAPQTRATALVLLFLSGLLWTITALGLGLRSEAKNFLNLGLARIRRAGDARV